MGRKQWLSHGSGFAGPRTGYMRVEQRELLPAMHLVLGVVDVEHDAFGNLREAVAEQVDHRRHHALERDRAGQVFQPADGGLRAQIGAAVRPPADRHLERRIATQRVAVIGIGIAAGDQQRTKTDHLGNRVAHRGGIARIIDALRQPFGDAEPSLNLGQQQHAAVGGEPATIESDPYRLAANRWQTAENRITVDHGGRALRCRVVTPARHQNHARFQRFVQRPPLRPANSANFPG
jgi:hypothetical protein